MYLGEDELAHGDEACGDEERGQPGDGDVDLSRLLGEAGQHHAVLQVVQTHLNSQDQVTVASQCFGFTAPDPCRALNTKHCLRSTFVMITEQCGSMNPPLAKRLNKFERTCFFLFLTVSHSLSAVVSLLTQLLIRGSSL